MKSAPERLAAKLPPDGARVLLARIDECQRTRPGQAVELGKVVLMPGGALKLVLLEEYEWRQAGAAAGR